MHKNTANYIYRRNSTNLGIQKSSAFPKISPFEICIRLGVPLSRWSFVLLNFVGKAIGLAQILQDAACASSLWAPQGFQETGLSSKLTAASCFVLIGRYLFSGCLNNQTAPPQENKWWTAFLWLIVVAPELANFNVQQWFIGSSGIKTGPFPIAIVLLSWNQTSKSHLSFKSKTQNFIL